MISGKANSSSPGRQTGEDRRSESGRVKRVKPPLTEAKLRDLALHYAARFATTGARVESYLIRKIRERGLAEDADGRTVMVDIPALVARLVELGYVDDDAYARMRARDLGARGYGARRVDESLRDADSRVDECTIDSEFSAGMWHVQQTGAIRQGVGGWRAIQGEALDLYMRWARQEPVEQEYVVGMEPG